MENRTSASSLGLYVVFFAGLVFAAALFGVGLYLATQGRGMSLLAAGSVSLIAIVVTWPIASALQTLQQSTTQAQNQLQTTVSERLEQVSVLLNLISEQQLLSDRAKAVAYREKDRDALRRAINEEMARQDWEAALALASDIEQNFGYRQEADRLREQINNRRQDIIRKQVNETVSVIDRYAKSEQWSMAHREAERLLRLFPDDLQVQRLPEEIESRRQAFKRQLRDNWNEAVMRHDVDGSIAILKKLDLYLTPSEAELMQETVRGIFKEKLNILRSQFVAAVREEKWTEAIRVGELVMQEFPNSRASQEVRENMDRLRQRAAEAPSGKPVGANA